VYSAVSTIQYNTIQTEFLVRRLQFTEDRGRILYVVKSKFCSGDQTAVNSDSRPPDVT